MAATHVALLRGINVGKAKRIAMADLRAIVEGLGFSEVKTLLNSGNVVFRATAASAKTAARRIEKGIVEELGISSRVIVLSAADVAEAIEKNPFHTVATDPTRLLIAAFGDELDRSKLAPLARQTWHPEAFAVGSRVAYLWCANGLLASKMPDLVARALGNGVTTRNLATMTKILATTIAAPKAP